MQYKPKHLEENVNVTKRQPLKEFVTLMAGLCALMVVVYAIAGLFINWSIDYISPKTEFELFNQYGTEPFKPVLQDKLSQADEPRALQLNALVQGMSSCVDIGYPITVYYSDDKLSNAVAIPGGQMVVFAGVFDNITSENGLSFVVAHELAHFANRDHIRSMGRGIVVIAATSLLGLSQSSITELVMPLESFGAAQFSQEIESAADKRALEILNCHYGHVGGATEFFEQLNTIEGDKRFELVHYFSTHPEIQSRIDNIHSLTEQLAYTQDAVLPLTTK